MEEKSKRKQRSDKGIHRSCSNCAWYTPYPEEYSIMYGGDCLKTGERMYSHEWCNHWRKDF